MFLTSMPVIAAVTGNVTTTVASATLRTKVSQAVTNIVSLQTSAAGALEAGTIPATVTTAPTGSTATPTWSAGTLGAAFVTDNTNNKYKMSYSGATASLTVTGTGPALNVAAQAVGVLSFTPDVAGSYVITVDPTALGVSGTHAAVTYSIDVSNTGTTAGFGCSTAYNKTSCTQVLGGSATVSLTGAIGTDATGGTRYTVSSSGVGSIGSATASTEDALTAATGYTAAARYLVGTTTAATYPNNSMDILTADTTAGTENGGVQGFDLVLTSAVAGTQTLTATKKDANGTPTSTYSISVTWTTAASTGINAAKSTLYVDTDADGCVAPGASKAADSVLAAAAAITRTPVATAVDVCVIARDANDNLLTVASATITGSFGRSDTSAEDETGEYQFDLAAASAVLSGTETITAVVIDAFGNAAVLTTTLSVYGSLKTLAISAIRGSAAANGSAGTDTYAGYEDYTSATNDIVVALTGKDSTGSVIDLQVANNTTSTANWTVDSDKVAGAPADRTSQTLGSSVAAIYPEAGELSSTKYGTNAAYITCGTLAEKLTVTAWGKDSDSNWVKSNSLDVYCAGAASTVTVTPSATSVASGATGTVNVSVKDANGYPVADGTAVTLAANNGAVVAPESKTTVNGAFATAANLIVGTSSASTTISAIAGGKTGTATVTITGGSSKAALLSQLDALNAKIVALNALIAKIMKKLGVK